MVKIKYAYCNFCKKEINEPIKKPMDSMEKTIWIILILATLGFGIIGFLIYNYYWRKRTYCPNCHSKLVYSSEPFEKPKLEETLTAKQKVMKKASEKKAATPLKKEAVVAKKAEKTFVCPFCGEELKEKLATCPFCGEALKF